MSSVFRGLVLPLDHDVEMTRSHCTVQVGVRLLELGFGTSWGRPAPVGDSHPQCPRIGTATPLLSVPSGSKEACFWRYKGSPSDVPHPREPSRHLGSSPCLERP